MAQQTDGTGALSSMRRIAVICLMGSGVAGCNGAGLDIAGAVKIDRSLTTGSLPVANGPIVSDAVTVRNAVSSADLSKEPGYRVPWANFSSGSTGVIISISQSRVDDVACRRFLTTLHSYQGVAQYDGTICHLPSGEWIMTSFEPRH